MQRQKLHDVELGAREGHVRAVHRERARGAVDGPCAHAQHVAARLRRGDAAAVAQLHLDAREQLVQVEGLG